MTRTSTFNTSSQLQKQQSNNAKECQHQNNVAGGLGRGPGPLGPQAWAPAAGAEGVFFVFFVVSGFLACFFFFFGGWVFLCFYRKSTSRARFPKPREKKKQAKKPETKKKKHLPGASCRGPSQDPGDPGGLGPGPGPRPHYFDVGTLLHCLIAALEL